MCVGNIVVVQNTCTHVARVYSTTHLNDSPTLLTPTQGYNCLGKLSLLKYYRSMSVAQYKASTMKTPVCVCLDMQCACGASNRWPNFKYRASVWADSPTSSSFLIFLKVFMSLSTVRTPSMVANWLSRPRVNSMTKNSKAQNGEPGIRKRASPNITNARPGPSDTYVSLQCIVDL